MHTFKLISPGIYLSGILFLHTLSIFFSLKRTSEPLLVFVSEKQETREYGVSDLL